MSLFRKQPQTPGLEPEPQQEPLSETLRLFEASSVDIAAIYRFAKLTPEDLDRVTRAGELLHHLPKKESHVRDVVEATFRAFGVDQVMILQSARKQLDALEAFIRFSHEHTQRILDASARRISELQAEIEKCRHAADQTTREGEERARTVNNELIKVQHVLEFFGENAAPEALDEETFVSKPDDDDNDKANVAKPLGPAPLPLPPSGKPANRRG